MSFSGVVFRSLSFSGQRTGALDLGFATRRVLSIPSQLGCSVGCSFCISRVTPLIRNLKASEMLALVQLCLEEAPPDGRSLELSFTGEGEPLLNWREINRVCHALKELQLPIDSVRVCLSGVAVDKLLPKLDVAGFPLRIQVSLHAARQEVRDSLIARSTDLATLEKSLRAHEDRFTSIELNVVLQDGVNDQVEDLWELGTWGDKRWPILLNPLLQDGQEVVAARTPDFEAGLLAAGRTVRRYERVGARISRMGLYPRLTASASSVVGHTL